MGEVRGDSFSTFLGNQYFRIKKLLPPKKTGIESSRSCNLKNPLESMQKPFNVDNKTVTSMEKRMRFFSIFIGNPST